VRLSSASALLAAAAAFAAGSLSAADECRGLPVCIPVRGPWVVIPAPSPRQPYPASSWRLVCPQGVVGGLDARLTGRAIDVTFAGLLGSPVGPGVTTEREVVVSGRYTGQARRPSAFKPSIGCIPAGGGRVPTARVAVRPGRPTLVRARTAALVAGRPLAVAHRCLPGERLIASSQAVGLASRLPPSPAQLAAVRSTIRRQGEGVLARARLAPSLAGVRAQLQVLVVCSREGRAP
jgi:hypothetical protein